MTRSPPTSGTRLTLGGARTGFTLLELLVAGTITVLLAGLMAAVITGTLGLWQRTQDNSLAAAQAVTLLDLLERDLQAACFRSDGSVWLAIDLTESPASLALHGWLAGGKPAGAASLRLLPDEGGAPTALAAARFGRSGTWLRLITTNLESGGSLPAAVSYQLARRPVSGPITPTSVIPVRYTLFRSVVTADNTFAKGYDVTAAGYGSTSSSPAATRTPATLTNPNGADALATNVVDFGLWCHVRTSNGGLRRIFPADNLDLSHRADSTSVDACRFPDVVDVMVRILTEHGAELLATIESGNGRIIRPPAYATDADWWWGVVLANSRVYTRRIETRGSGL